ncbi:MAG: tripartite tricarboxylate transporter substrate binding protein [Proteobacteria bacterium]|nr:tripartite tricarboxylate transporter substrate binding protein [Burkholderiales bacterium]
MSVGRSSDVRNTRVTGYLMMCLAWSFAQDASAQSGAAYPNRPLRFIVPFTPGGSNDIFGRVVGQRLSEAMGQPVLIDNRPGAGGLLGAEIVAKAPPDGYNLMIHSTSFTTNVAIQARVPFDPFKDFAPITQLGVGSLLMTVNATSPVKTMQDLLVLARAKPGTLNYGSSGTGGINHLATEVLNRSARIDTVHIPYKGIGPAVTDLLGGQLQMLLSGIPNVIAQVKAGKLRPLAVSTAKRSAFLPDVPTIAESGVPDYSVVLWWGLFAPGGTSTAIVARLNTEVRKILESGEMRERLAAEGAEPAPTSPEVFAKLVRDEIQFWRKVARDAGIKPE